MSNKYLVFTDSGFYFFNTEEGLGLSSLKNHATQYDLDEAIKIRQSHPHPHWNINFESVDSLDTPLEISIQSIAPDDTDYDLYAKYTAKQWTQAVSYYRNFIEAPENQEKLQQAIARLTAYLEKQKQNPNYKFHVVTYVGFPLDLSDYTVQNFAPYFNLEVNYGADSSSGVNFLIK